MWLLPVFLGALLGLCQARHFNNPVLDNADYPDPGTIKVNGVYYVVTTTNNDEWEKYPIHRSTDLQNWQFVGYVFQESNFPSWSRKEHEFWAPELHQVGNGFRCYFSARHHEYNTLAVGVAYADNVEGPYTDIGRSLLPTGPGGFFWDSTLVNANGKLMLSYVDGKFIEIRNLTDDGLSFSDDVVVPLFQPELSWEGTTNEGPWYVFRNNWHYMFYSAANFCSDTYTLGVARSRNPTGPYEKYPDPLISSTDAFKGPGHGSIVKDIDDQSYVFVHHAWRKDQVCGSNFRYTLCSSMEWGDDDWPRKMTIGE